MPFRFSERVASFRHAFRGIGLLIRTQHNAWIHLVATAGVIAAGFGFGLERWEWVALLLAIGLVWTAEAVNTAVELLGDEISQERRERIGAAKDAGAAGVLLASIAAAMVGLIVFAPHVLALLEKR
jgi:diacylglycerol kinase (ATP)